MNKLKLEIESLRVESFDTDASRGNGTVVGAMQAVPGQTYPNCSEIDACPSAWNCTVNGTCYDATCAQAGTCVKTCAASCQATCQASCGFASGCLGCSGPVCAA